MAHVGTRGCKARGIVLKEKEDLTQAVQVRGRGYAVRVGHAWARGTRHVCGGCVRGWEDAYLAGVGMRQMYRHGAEPIHSVL